MPESCFERACRRSRALLDATYLPNILWSLRELEGIDLHHVLSRNAIFVECVVRDARRNGSLSPRQAMALREFWQELASRVEGCRHPVPVPVGEAVELEGRVERVYVSTKRIPRLVLRLPSGARLDGYLPGSAGRAMAGDSVYLVADVAAYGERTSFGFFTHPRGVRLTHRSI